LRYATSTVIPKLVRQRVSKVATFMCPRMERSSPLVVRTAASVCSGSRARRRVSKKRIVR